MTVGDLLSFIGIILAIFAFLNEKERLFISIKITKIEKNLLLLLFFLIVYLVLFDGFFQPLGWYFDELLTDDGLSADIYAFQLSLLIVGFILLKILVFPFPKKNTKKLIEFYGRLILRGDHVSVLDFIDRYHVKALCEYLNRRTHEFLEWSKTNAPNYDYGALHNFDEHVTKTNYSDISERLITEILSKEHFIFHTASYSPDTYCRIIGAFKFPSPFGRFIFKKFIESLVLNKNVLINYGFHQIDRWDDLRIKKSYTYFWNLLSDRSLIECHAFTRHLGILGQRILDKKEMVAILNSEYDRRIDEGELQELEIMEVIVILRQIAHTVIVHKIENPKYKSYYFMDFFNKYCTAILVKITLPATYKEYESGFMNFGLAIIEEITGVLEYTMGRLTFLGGHSGYIDEIVNCYLSILWSISQYPCPPDFLESIYQRLFKIYGLVDQNDQQNTLPNEIRRSIRKNLTESALGKLPYRKHKDELKKQWHSYNPPYSEPVRKEFDLFIEQL